MKEKKGIIFAADIINKERLLDITREISPFIDAIKVGNLALYFHSWNLIREIKKITDLPIIADLKLMDIPEMAGRIAESAAEAGADGMMVCGTAGIDTIGACRVFFSDKLLFVFTEFTHSSGRIDKKKANENIDLAINLRVDGIQVPGTKMRRIKEAREKVGKDMLIISCGIGSQKYVDGRIGKPDFGSAIASGADYEIIGRSIYDAELYGSSPIDIARIARKSILEIVNLERR